MKLHVDALPAGLEFLLQAVLEDKWTEALLRDKVLAEIFWYHRRPEQFPRIGIKWVVNLLEGKIVFLQIATTQAWDLSRLDQGQPCWQAEKGYWHQLSPKMSGLWVLEAGKEMVRPITDGGELGKIMKLAGFNSKVWPELGSGTETVPLGAFLEEVFVPKDANRGRLTREDFVGPIQNRLDGGSGRLRYGEHVAEDKALPADSDAPANDPSSTPDP